MHETRLVVRRSRAISTDVGAEPLFEFGAISLSPSGRRARRARLQAQIGKLAMRASARRASQRTGPGAMLTPRVTTRWAPTLGDQGAARRGGSGASIYRDWGSTNRSVDRKTPRAPPWRYERLASLVVALPLAGRRSDRAFASGRWRRDAASHESKGSIGMGSSFFSTSPSLRRNSQS
jgi:hypothetical protein